MTPFLKAVAGAYAARYHDLSRFCFIFPNKRSGKFFLKYLQESAPHEMVAPEVATVTDLAATVADRDVDSAIDLLFRLFDCYRRMTGGKADFDSFRLWGETALQDFNEVDMQLVPVDEIFKNVSDFKEISSNFLTPEQRAVMEEYFGYTGPDHGEEGFWRQFNSKEGNQVLKGRFIQLWRVLAPLWHDLRHSLDGENLATPGGIYRIAAERMESLGEEFRWPWQKTVFVGFNALSRAERSIFSSFRTLSTGVRGHAADEPESQADFIWDLGGPLLQGEGNPAGHFVRINRREFPEPEWIMGALREAMPEGLPEELRSVGAPSRVIQCKLAGEEVGRLFHRLGKRDFEDARVAIVLPDEGLLQPMLYSLPPEIETINLTMGYPLRLTPAVSFVDSLRRLQVRQRSWRGSPAYYLDELRLTLSHPFPQMLFGSGRIAAFLRDKAAAHQMYVAESELLERFPDSKPIFTPLAASSDARAAIAYIDGALKFVEENLGRVGSPMLKERIERQNISSYRDALARVEDALREYEVKASAYSMFSMVSKLIARETVTFEGEPLSGLQVMGMLETRSLDFDHVIIPSVNDKILPRQSRQRTFIPNTLRRAYGMPKANYQENLFAYYFLRLISRPQGVTMLYDMRESASGTGGISRYILQLRHLLAPGVLKEETRGFQISTLTPTPRTASKADWLQRLALYTAKEGGRYLSATALNEYIACPMRFFYRRIVGVPEPPETMETLSPSVQGSVVHGAMMNLYLPAREDQGRILDTPVEVTEDMISDLLGDRDRIERLVIRMINLCHAHRKEGEEAADTPLEGSAAILLPGLVDQVMDILRRDKRHTPFLLYGCEVERKVRFPLADGRETNITYTIDRIDRLPGGGVRIVDYKTGSVRMGLATFGEIFTNHRAHIPFQLMLYATLLGMDKGAGLPDPGGDGYLMEVINVPRVLDENRGIVGLTVGEEPVAGHAHYSGEFSSGLDRLITTILDPGCDFCSTDDPGQCVWCNYRHLCQR